MTRLLICLTTAAALFETTGRARQVATLPAPPTEYQQVKAFALTGDRVDLNSFTFTRDRAVMTLTGTVYFAAPVDAHVTGAVFIGQGTLHADVPPTPGDFEKKSVQRLLGADVVESDFKTAVFRMTDDAHDVLMQGKVTPTTRTIGVAEVPQAATKLAADFEPRLLQETGINLSARLTLSLLNGETPGVFVAEFDGGRRGRFDLALDYQTRLQTAAFGINAGEKGVFWQYSPSIYSADPWMAFYAQAEYGHVVAYADANDLVDVQHYGLDMNLRNPSAHLAYTATIDMIVRQPHVKAINFRVGEALGTYEDARLKQQLRLKGARLGATPIAAVQEDWEGGFTVYLPAEIPAGDHLVLAVDLDGNFFHGRDDTYFPLSNDAWLPRHGDLDRATFDMTYHHLKRHKVASSGVRLSELPDATQPEFMTTTYQLDVPVPLVTFAVGQFERSKMTAEWEKGGAPITVEFNNVSSHVAQIRDDFILAEMDNAVRFFAAIFGKYPYPVLNGCVHPFGFGQGFATLLMLAPADRADRNGFSFIAHETSHQWWGNIVAWRSYRDQWLSEGFAEYSGMLYTAAREGPKDGPKDQAELIRVAREKLRLPPHTTVGLAKGRLADIGPIILGHRLDTTKSAGAYTALIYSKGALVLRMLHFLLTNPSTGDEKTSAFYPMMTAFVNKYRNGTASTENFQAIASEYFAKSPIAQKYSVSNLDWFFDQWVYQSDLPSYTMEYELKDQPGGACLVVGTLRQDGVSGSWVMPLPVIFTLGGGQIARTTVIASGASTPFQVKLPSRPAKVELDPESWILSDKTTTKGK